MRIFIKVGLCVLIASMAEAKDVAKVEKMKYKNGSLAIKKCDNNLIKTLGIDTAQVNTPIKYLTEVVDGFKSAGNGKVIGYAFVSGEDCKPNFYFLNDNKLYGSVREFESTKLQSCSLQEVVAKLRGVVNGAAFEIRGRPNSAAANFGADKWWPDDRPFCNELLKQKESGCTAVCASLIKSYGDKKAFCNKFLKEMIEMGDDSCAPCCN